MFRKVAFIVPLALLLGAFVAPGLVAATGDNSNRAGRVIGGAKSNSVAGQNCQGIAYGKVNGGKVLFTAAHCRKGAGAGQGGCTNTPPWGCVNNLDEPGDPVYGPNGQQIGTWGYFYHATDDHDLTFININAASWPNNPGEIFRGHYAGAPNWWDLTVPPNSGYSSCDAGTTESNGDASARDWYGQEIRQAAQDDGGGDDLLDRASDLHGWGTAPYGTGTSRNCTIKTDLIVRTVFPSVTESGSPVVRLHASGEVRLFGHMSGSYSCGFLQQCLTVIPFYHALAAMDAFWVPTGAWVCQNGNCTDPT